MTTTVIWSSNLRVIVKKLKKMRAITSRDAVDNLTLSEVNAVQKQLLKNSDVNINGGFWA